MENYKSPYDYVHAQLHDIIDIYAPLSHCTVFSLSKQMSYRPNYK